MKPYYQDDYATIFHGDCREVLPQLDQVDLVLTDPPYGIGFKYDGYDDSLDNWTELMDAAVPLMRKAAAFVIMPVCAIVRMDWWYANHKPDWLIAWYKGSPGHRSAIGFNDWEPLLVWGKPPKPMHDYFQVSGSFDDSGHPCPKPLQWSRWLMYRGCPPGGTVLDPFAGSGTTLRVAKDLERKSIGIEINEAYCEIAAKRLAQGVLPLFTEPPRATDPPELFTTEDNA